MHWQHWQIMKNFNIEEVKSFFALIGMSALLFGYFKYESWGINEAKAKHQRDVEYCQNTKLVRNSDTFKCADILWDEARKKSYR